jgi:hypothetical protein
MSLSTTEINVSNIKIKNEPTDEQHVVNKKYVSKNFIKTNVDYSDIPNDINTGTNFSFRDMANAVLILENEIYNNPTIKNYILNWNQNPDFQNLGITMNNIHLILTNICRNFVNNPENVCLDPECFYIRVELLTSSGQTFVDAITYKSDPKGVNKRLHLDRNIVYLEVKENILNGSLENPNIIYNPTNINTSNLVSEGIIVKKRLTALTEPDLVNGEYNKNLNVINPTASSKTPLYYEITRDMSSTQDVLDAVKNGWGWCSKLKRSEGNLPGYFISHNTNIPVADDYYAIIRLSYQIY